MSFKSEKGEGRSRNWCSIIGLDRLHRQPIPVRVAEYHDGRKQRSVLTTRTHRSYSYILRCIRSSVLRHPIRVSICSLLLRLFIWWLCAAKLPRCQELTVADRPKRDGCALWRQSKRIGAELHAAVALSISRIIPFPFLFPDRVNSAHPSSSSFSVCSGTATRAPMTVLWYDRTRRKTKQYSLPLPRLFTVLRSYQSTMAQPCALVHRS